MNMCLPNSDHCSIKKENTHNVKNKTANLLKRCINILKREKQNVILHFNINEFTVFSWFTFQFKKCYNIS